MTIQIKDVRNFRAKALHWATSFEVCCFLDSNNFSDPYSKIDTLIAVGAKYELSADAGDAFNALNKFRTEHQGWLTGFLGYDLKNETERLTSANLDNLQFPDLYFFVPEYLIIIRGDEIEIIANNPQSVYNNILQQEFSDLTNATNIKIQSRLSKGAYIDKIDQIKEHINRGDIYITNFCLEFYAENATIDPVGIFEKLNAISPNPFASFFKWKQNYILCASPERFLAKRGNQLISQPIKGTAKRGATEREDAIIKQELRNHAKELQENVMIVDLVRNDLTRSAKQGTVKTEELFGIYTFQHLHQMISTVTCELQEGISTVQAIKNSFPMGSMTGAPKLSSMHLMEDFEESRRGVYSGAIGYFSPDNDFDFNVVIRALLYNSENKYLSFQAGSAITYHADAEKEYEECMLKVKAIMEVLVIINN